MPSRPRVQRAGCRLLGRDTEQQKTIVDCPYEQDCKVDKQPCYDDCMLFTNNHIDKYACVK